MNRFEQKRLEEERAVWQVKFADMTKDQKELELLKCINQIWIPEVNYLLQEGVRLPDHFLSPDIFANVLERTTDTDFINTLFDLGFKALKVTAKTAGHFISTGDTAAQGVLQHMTDTGLPLSERAKAILHCFGVGHGFLAPALIKDGEDIISMFNAMPSKKGETHIETTPTGVWKGVLDLVDEDKRFHQDLYAAHFTPDVTPEKLAQTLTAQGMTGWMLAIRANKIDAALEPFLKPGGAVLSLDDLLTKDCHEQSPLSLLSYRRDVAKLTAPSLWVGRTDQLEILLDSLPYSAMQGLDTERLLTEARLLSVRVVAAATPRLRL